MIRIRGTPITGRDAAGLARGLRAHGTAAHDVADRLERALLMGTGMIGIATTEARALLAVLEERSDGRLREIEDELREFVGEARRP